MCAALAVVAVHGPAGVTVSRLVAASGLSRGMFNLHFGTKRRLLLTLLRRLSRRRILRLKEDIDARGGDIFLAFAAHLDPAKRTAFELSEVQAWQHFCSEALIHQHYVKPIGEYEDYRLSVLREFLVRSLWKDANRSDMNARAMLISVILDGIERSFMQTWAHSKGKAAPTQLATLSRRHLIDCMIRIAQEAHPAKQNGLDLDRATATSCGVTRDSHKTGNAGRVRRQYTIGALRNEQGR
ncbi:MAG: helix-turn-helix transcriptional regulator [Rhodospirillales bacterium]|nr:helix-turn-helix transcriptional regulator [Rhodospirillales bacterium]